MPFAAVTLCLLAGKEGARSLSALPAPAALVCVVFWGGKHNRAAWEGSLGKEKAGAGFELPKILLGWEQEGTNQGRGTASSLL